MSLPHAIPRIGPRPVGDADASVSAQRRPSGTFFPVLRRWCNRESPLSWRARHVLAHIAMRVDADDEGRQVAFMGEGTLVEDTGLSLSTVRRAVRELREAGVIKTSPGGVTRGHRHRCNEFEIIG